jgi:CubicO group peptidase (beta-lactamase class C family)
VKKHFISMIVTAVLFINMLPVYGFTSDQLYWPDQEWRITSPEEQGMDSNLIVAMLEQITQQQLDIHSLLIIRHGYMVTEAYWAPYTREIQHPLFSVTKSLTSALTGIAMDEGYIKSLKQPVLDFFPEIQQEMTDKLLRELTLEHLLTMSAGYQTNTLPNLYGKDASFDAVKYILTHNSILEPPGTTFSYDNGCPHLLSAILQKTTGKPLIDYAKEKLFVPLGITNMTWQSDPQGITLGNTGLMLTPRDLAKIGYLYLHHGQWHDQQILPETWVELSTQKHIDTAGKMNAAENDGYGYFWWMNGFDGYAAHGFSGQYLFVMPSLDLIVVFTAGLKLPDFPKPDELVKTYILLAAQSATPLNPNPQASQALKMTSAQLENPEPKPVGALPETAKRISGKTFRITQDGSGGYFCKTVVLTFTDGDKYTSESLWPDGKIYVVQGGLNNTFHINTIERNQQPVKVALKAYWQDEKTFIEYDKDFSQIDMAIHTYTFEGNKLTIAINSSMGAYSFQAVGEMVE